MRAAHLLTREFIRAHPADAARVLERLPAHEAAALLADLPPSLAALGLERMVPPTAAESLARMPGERAALVVEKLPGDVAGRLLLRLAGEQREELLSRVTPEAAAALGRRLAYRPGTAGALMDAQVHCLAAGMTAGQALSLLRRSPRRAHYYLYVVEPDGRLVGVLNLRQLMRAEPHRSLASLMSPEVMRLQDTADRELILAHPGWRRVHALPVVDAEGRFLGVVRHETVRELELDRVARPGGRPPALGLALADLCWVGMAGILDGLAAAAFPRSAAERASGGGER